MRTLRAFLWLRWRLMVNGLLGGRGRDVMAWFATWAAVLVRILLGVILLGAVTVLSLVAGVLASKMARPHGLGPDVAILGFRVVLGVLSLVLVLFPLMTRSGGDLASAQRLRLLPIRGRHLDLFDIVGAFADPWMIGILPVPLVMTTVFWWHGRVLLGGVTLVAGVLLLTCLALASTVMRRVAALVLRDRRRAESAALLLIVGLMVLSTGTVWIEPLIEDSGVVEPNVVVVDEHGEEVQPATDTNPPESEAKKPRTEIKMARSFPAALQPLPSELFVRALVGAMDTNHGVTSVCLAALAALCVALYFVARCLWHLTVGSPGISGRARSSSRWIAGIDRLPGLSPAATAVAWAQVATALRTLPGKLALGMPTLAMLVIVVPLRTALAKEDSFILDLFEGPQLALGVVALTMLSIQPFTFNQFASDGEGLARQLLVPLRSRDLILGKAVGLGALALLSTLVAVLAVAALVGKGSLGSWLAIFLTALPVYLLMAPVSVVLSLYFPKAMDLGGLGNKSKPHALAAFLGFLAFGAVVSPVFGVVIVGIGLLGAPWWTALTVGLFTVFTAVAALVFLHFAAPVLPVRSEAILAAIRDK